MRKCTKKVFFGLFLILSLVSCDEGNKTKIAEKPEGSVGGPCYGNGTCDDGLVCVDDICIDPEKINDTDSGNTADDGDTGNSGNTGDSGDSGDTGDTGDSGDSGDSGNTGDTGNSGTDDEKPDEDNKIPETCGNGKAYEGEECDDGNDWGGDGCTPECKINVCGDGYKFVGVEECDTKEVSCASLGIGTEGDALCDYYCKIVTEGACKKTFKCSEKPENTVWNSVSEYIQTWNGTEWEPADSIATYNVTTSTEECRFKCAENYLRYGTSCVQGSTMGAICTGQIKCYNGTAETTCPSSGEAYYGQDAQYAAMDYCSTRSFTISGTNPQEIVTDNNIGLQWQRTISTSTYTWADAGPYCDGLNYGFEVDWRLPTYSELGTLIDYGRHDLAMDSTYFPSTPSMNYFFWSSSDSLYSTECAWEVRFADGTTKDISTKTNTFYARCVRGAALTASNFTESTVSGKVIVTDSVTRLIWTKEYSSVVTWVNALSYCETLDYGGYAYWRLPNVNELKTLVNITKSDPASDFPSMPSISFWSSSSYVNNANYAWAVNFDYGVVSMSGKSFSVVAKCVR